MGRVMKETLLPWRLNGVEQPALLCSPGMERELLCGHLLTGLFVRGVQEITAITSNDNIWCVETSGAPRPGDLPARLEALAPCGSDRRIALDEVKALSGRLMTWDNAQGQHAVLLSDGAREAFGCDIGRHNALDKAIGAGLAAGLRLGDAVMCTSGRLSIESLAKAAAAGIPIVCTRKQVGDLACAWAERLGVAIVQTGRDTDIFGAAERIIREDEL